MKKIILIVFIAVLIIAGCKKDEKDQEKALLMEYLLKKNITTPPKPSGLYYIETLAGTGEYPVTGDWVALHYTGTLIDSTVFDSSIPSGNPFAFKVGASQVIEGWDEGVRYMKPGGKATFIIPSSLAYGGNRTGSIPPYSTLIFYVELVAVDTTK